MRHPVDWLVVLGPFCWLEVEVVARYRAQGRAVGDAAATLFLLLDLATFFDLYHGAKLKEALETLGKLKLVTESPDHLIT